MRSVWVISGFDPLEEPMAGPVGGGGPLVVVVGKLEVNEFPPGEKGPMRPRRRVDKTSI
jgi:hypothetical protein